MDQLTLAQANKIIEAALSVARQRGFRPMTVVVLDTAGHVRSLQREDGASMFRADIASGKAWASVSMGASSRNLGNSARENPNFYGSLPVISQGKFIAHTGAVLIKNASGAILGAVGASGGTGDEDEAICMAGVEAAGLLHS
jgi:uncharacterized protein GlcG (DUF336 family)